MTEYFDAAESAAGLTAGLDDGPLRDFEEPPEDPYAGYAPPEDYAAREPERLDTPSWKPIDLGPFLSGNYTPPQPTVGQRDDGVRIFYPGRISSVFSEPEAGKTWFAMIVSAGEMKAGNHVVCLDFEDAPEGIVTRLLDLGVTPEMIAKQFTYIQPQEQPSLVGMAYLMEAITAQTTVVWVDGVTEAMSLYGLDPKSDIEVAAFWRRLFRPIAAAGPAVVALDHVVKNRDARGRWATGSQHKLSGLNGCAYVLENIAPFGSGIKGRTRIYVAKDRPGQVRKNALPTKHEPPYWFGDMVIDSQEGGALCWLYPPLEAATSSEPRESVLQIPFESMEAVSRALEGADEGLSGNALEGLVSKGRTTVRAAVEVLKKDGYITEHAGARNARIFRSAKPYRMPAGEGS